MTERYLRQRPGPRRRDRRTLLTLDGEEAGPPHDQETDARDGSSHPLEEILQKAINRTDGETTTVGDLLHAFGARALGPVLILFGLVALLPPMSIVPGVPAVAGIIIFLFAVQFVFGKKTVWLPSRLRDIGIARDRLTRAEQKSEVWLRRVDGLFSQRLGFLTGPAMERVAAVLASLLALTMIPLEIVPGAVAAPAAALVFFGVALMARDGLFMILALIGTVATGYFGMTALAGVGGS